MVSMKKELRAYQEERREARRMLERQTGSISPEMELPWARRRYVLASSPCSDEESLSMESWGKEVSLSTHEEGVRLYKRKKNLPVNFPRGEPVDPSFSFQVESHLTRAIGLVDLSTIQGPPPSSPEDVHALPLTTCSLPVETHSSPEDFYPLQDDLPLPPVDIFITPRSPSHIPGVTSIGGATFPEKTSPKVLGVTSFETFDLLIHHTMEWSKEDHPPPEKPST